MSGITPEEFVDQERPEIFIQDQRRALWLAEQRRENRGLQQGIQPCRTTAMLEVARYLPRLNPLDNAAITAATRLNVADVARLRAGQVSEK